MLDLKRNLLSIALASAVLSLAAQAQAQDGQDTDSEAGQDEAAMLDRVTVTGIRAGIENAIDTKQSASAIVEAISAEDIGKLPDISIADSLARLPGLTAQRERGRASEINIRGLSGDFAATTLNGREQVTLSDNRGVEFDQYPSELISQVLVYKTPTASLVGQGLSGTIDLQTVRPLSFPDRVVAINGRYDQNRMDGLKESGERFALSYIDQFADNTIGLALGYARLNNPGQAREFEAWGYDDAGLLGGGKFVDFKSTNEREGLMGVLEFRPNEFFSSTLDLYHSTFDRRETRRNMEFGLGWGRGSLVSRSDWPDGTARQIEWDNPLVVLKTEPISFDDRLTSVGWRNEWQFAQNWSLMVDYNHSRGRRDQQILESYAGIPGQTDRWRLAFNEDGYFDVDTLLDYADPSIVRLGDPGGWGQDGYIKDFEVRDRIDAVRIEVERSIDAGPVAAVRAGTNFTNRHKSRASNENFLCLIACNDGAMAEVPAELIGDSTFGFAGIPGYLSYDAFGVLARLYNRRSNNNNDIAAKNWDIRENINTTYVQLDIDADLGPVPVRGNIGVQAVRVDQYSTGFATYAGNDVGDPIEGGASYTDILPALNLAFSLPAENVIRVGAGRQVARPRMDEMRAGADYGIEQVPDTRPDGTVGPYWSGGGGNPELRPWKANAYDLAWEKYFGGRGYFSVAYFYKDLQTYIYNQRQPFDYTGLEVPENVPPEAIPDTRIGWFNQPANGEGGVLKGWEFALSVPFDMLWSPLEGFGLQASYTDSTTSIAPEGPGSESPLPGFSKYTSNVTLYYERFGFSTRVSRRSRSEFLGESQGFGGDRVRQMVEGEAVVDLQLGYQLQSGPLEGLQFLFQVNNLTDEPFKRNFGSSTQPQFFSEYGRNYLLGFNYRF